RGAPRAPTQLRTSLLPRRPERDLLPHAAATGRVVIAYSPLAQGVLAAKYTADTAPGGVRARNLLFSAENLRRAGPVLDALRELDDAHPATPAQRAPARGGPGLGGLPPQRGRHPRGHVGRPGGGQRRRRRPAPGPRRAGPPDRGRRPLRARAGGQRRRRPPP